MLAKVNKIGQDLGQDWRVSSWEATTQSGVITMPDPDKRAIVVGASMGGLLAARALADYYGEVTIVERDALPDG